MVCNVRLYIYMEESEKEKDNLYGYTFNEPINPKSNAKIFNAHGKTLTRPLIKSVHESHSPVAPCRDHRLLK